MVRASKRSLTSTDESWILVVAAASALAFEAITGLRSPDLSTIAEFRRRHETEIAELLDDILALCREAGLVSVGVITIDAIKLMANASMDQNRSYREIATEILREAEEIDRQEAGPLTRVQTARPSSLTR